jgi:hypothetical protein
MSTAASATLNVRLTTPSARSERRDDSEQAEALILAGLGFVILALGGEFRQRSPKENDSALAVSG